MMILPSRAQQDLPRLLIPMGGGYADIYPGFCKSAIERAENSTVNILVLALPIQTQPGNISDEDRQQTLIAAENRRFQIEEACQRAAPEGVTIEAILAPILVRSDALEPASLTSLQKT